MPERKLATAFLSGVKDCILVQYDDRLIDDLIELGVYYRVFNREREGRKWRDGWFFKNAHLMYQFDKSALGKENRADTRALGTLLGYPPLAVEEFTKRNKEHKMFKNDKIVVEYCGGMVFVSYRHTLLKDLQWLLARSIPREINLLDMKLFFYYTGVEYKFGKEDILSGHFMNNVYSAMIKEYREVKM